MSRSTYERDLVLQPILDKLTSLEANTYFTISDTPERINSIRTWVYQSLQNQGLTKNYKIFRVAPDNLQILRRSLHTAKLEDQPIETQTLEPKLQNILDTILDFPEDIAAKTLSLARNEGQLTPSEASLIMERYNKHLLSSIKSFERKAN